MRLGDVGENVRSLQESLNEISYRLEPDGHFGPKTQNAVVHFQKTHDLVADGIVGPKTIGRMANLSNPGYLRQRSIEEAADRLCVPVAAIMAFNEVESRGQGFIDTHKPAILFERHVMRRRLLRLDGFNVEQLEQDDPGIVNRRPGGYRGGPQEYVRLEKAKSIDVESAIESTSWGLFQILGLHWERLGFASAGDYAATMKECENQHLRALATFIETDPCLHNAIKDRDWKQVARIYNGPAYANNSYDVKLQTAYERYVALLDEAEKPKEVIES